QSAPWAPAASARVVKERNDGIGRAPRYEIGPRWTETRGLYWNRSRPPLVPIHTLPSRSCSTQYTKSLVRPSCCVNASTPELWNCHAEGPLIFGGWRRSGYGTRRIPVPALVSQRLP